VDQHHGTRPLCPIPLSRLFESAAATACSRLVAAKNYDGFALKHASFEPSGELSHVYDHPGMGANPDLFGAFGRPHRELDLPTVDFRQSASPLTKRPSGVAARWRTLTAVPTALSAGSR